MAKRASLSVDEAVARIAAGRRAENPAPPAEPEPTSPDPAETTPDDGAPDAVDAASEEEPQPEASDDAPDVDDSRYLVTVDGEEYEVSLSELIKGYQLESSARKRHEALAEERRAVEQRGKDLEALAAEMSAERVEIKKQGERYDAALGGLQNILDQRKSEWDKVNWAELKENDPEQYRELRVEFLAFQQEQRDLADEQRRREQEKQQEARQAQQEAAKRFRTAISKALPEWSDEAVRTKDWAGMYKLARSLEFTDEEINATTDPRIFLLLHKAMKGDRLANTKASATNQAPNRVTGREPAQPAKVIQPHGARPVATRAGNSGAQVREAMDRFKQTRSIDDAASFLSQARRQATARR